MLTPALKLLSMTECLKTLEFIKTKLKLVQLYQIE